ncbi:MAG TPA: hypothetical protein VMH39_16550 [Gemmatimonadaceae bacterium]|nr:hypothetical protein [Gemmatimonadaceae bacterium]
MRRSTLVVGATLSAMMLLARVGGGQAIGRHPAMANRSAIRGGAIPSDDSLARHDSAVTLVAEYEVQARDFVNPSTSKCERVGTVCRVIRCEAGPKAMPCVLGRQRPCAQHDGLFYLAGGLGMPACLGPPTRAAADSANLLRVRSELIRALGTFAAEIPGDRWVRGQLIYYMVAADAFDEADSVADACREPRGWCLELAGYAKARRGDVSGADSDFTRALAVLAPEERCAWADVGALLDSAAAARYATLPCGSAQRMAFESRIWWLADPSWIVPGNDRRIEHLARGVELAISLGLNTEFCGGGVTCDTRRFWLLTSAPFHPSIATDSTDLLRTGPNDSWWAAHVVGPRVGPDAPAVPSGCLLYRLRNSRARYHFVPEAHALESPLAAREDDWAPTAGPPNAFPSVDALHTAAGGSDCERQFAEPRAPERFTPTYAATVVPLPDRQVAYFRRGARGDSALLVAAVDLPSGAKAAAAAGDSRRSAAVGFFAYGRASAGGPPLDSARVIDSVAPARGRWTTALPVAWDSALVGIELLAGGTRGDSGFLARTRFGVAPPPEPAQRVGLSDILIYSPDSGAPKVLSGPGGAITRALGTTTLAGVKRIGLYWEAYGLAPGESGEVELHLVADPVVLSRVQRLLRALRLGAHQTSIRIAWRDPGGDAGGPDGALSANVGRATALDLGAIAPGPYHLELTFRVPGQLPVTVSRAIQIQ